MSVLSQLFPSDILGSFPGFPMPAVVTFAVATSVATSRTVRTIHPYTNTITQMNRINLPGNFARDWDRLIWCRALTGITTRLIVRKIKFSLVIRFGTGINLVWRVGGPGVLYKLL
ncbi:hypothetical protein GGX14DRAFT_394788 [Mycena pura]|uniref:Uncharacterized protein n=1 Tax=Mycena pura TaxID=153505 RepID=A0AAD6VDS7_9AGAR|nr:hypothetical protein GGX14DRAFT_394788 [Mycena pura]